MLYAKNFRITFLFALALFIANNGKAQTGFQFDFGSGRTAKGYLPVVPETLFNEERGYGFSHGLAVQSVDRGGDPLRGDFVTSQQPYYFSVKLPEGNYHVRLLLGDTKGLSATTVRVECRRLMLENVRTRRGEIVEKTFSVHIRDSLVRNKDGEIVNKVRLKPREHDYLHWDNLLTIEFNDSLAKVCGLIITPANNIPTIFLAGNSTVVDQNREPWAAWGQMFPVFIDPQKAVVANYAESGETLLAFKRERRLEKIWSMAGPGDFLFIEFAHNDQKPGGNHLDPFTTYKQELKNWINEARNRGVTPVLVTSMHRRNFDSGSQIINTLLTYPDAMRETAREEDVALIDLNAMSKSLYESLGPDLSIKAFVHYPANSFPDQPGELKDNTHFSPYGAYSLAQCVVSSIQQQALPLHSFLYPNIAPFDPARPMPFDRFYWPPSSFVSSIKPDGN